MRPLSAPVVAKTYLRDAAYRLGASDPSRVQEVSRTLEESMPLPVGHPAYWQKPPLTSSFAEERAGLLELDLAPLGPDAGPADRTEAATRTMEDLVGAQFGRDALRWLSSRIEPAVATGRTARWGAHLGTAFDRDGVRESMVTYECAPDVADGFTEKLFRLTRIAMETVPGLRPAYTSIRCGRTSGSQQVTFAVDAPLSLNALQPLMEGIGLGAKHASLMSAVAFVLGARFTLPPGSCSITLRPTRSGVELRLDVNLELVPDLPPQLMSLLRLQMAERPQSTRALDGWLIAMTPEGFDRPGTLYVLSVCVRNDMSARVGLHLRPPVLEAAPEQVAAPAPTTAPTPAPVPADGGGLPATASAGYAYAR